MKVDFDKQAVKVFKALSDPSRYATLRTLVGKGELSCADFDGRTGYPNPPPPSSL